MADARVQTRIVVFSALSDLKATPCWKILTDCLEIEEILVVRALPDRTFRAVLRRLRSNNRKLGLPTAGVESPQRPASLSKPVRVIETTDIHAPVVLEQVREWRPDLGVSVGAPVLRESLFAIPTRGTFNLHLGQVPEFLGAPPGFWEMYEGARTIGATAHWITSGLGTGPVIRSATAPLYPRDSLQESQDRVAELGAHVFSEALQMVLAATPQPAPEHLGFRNIRTPTAATRLMLGMRLALRKARRTLGSPFWLVKSGLSVGLLALVRPIRDLLRTIRAAHPVRIFTYHRVTALCRDGMTVAPATFSRHVRYLARTHHLVSLDEALRILREGRRLRRPVGVLTFDDAYGSVVRHAFPLLAHQNLTATVFVSTGFPGTTRRFDHDHESPVRDQLDIMTWEDLAMLSERGWGIGAHTVNHARLSRCEGPQLQDELLQPIETLKARLGLDNLLMAFPFGQPGDISLAATETARKAGYRAVFSDFGGENVPSGASEFEYRRIDIGGDHSSLAFRLMAHGILLSAYRASPET